MIEFNLYNTYVLFYSWPKHGKISIWTNLGNQVGAFVWILIFVHFLLHTSTLSRTLQLCGFYFRFGDFIY